MGTNKTDQAPLTWKLVELDKSLIRPNPNNPKVRKDKGFNQLKKLTDEFGVIFDGIVNADYSLIDGHSRLEMNPEGTGNYFMPSRQLNIDDQEKLNALFDMARAGDPDLFIIEQILGDEFLEEWESENKPEKKQKKLSEGNAKAKYPLVPQYDERYEAIVIMCTNNIDTLFIKNALGIGREMSYKNTMVKETSIVTAQKFIEKWNAKS